jgi:hypothetical protein
VLPVEDVLLRMPRRFRGSEVGFCGSVGFRAIVHAILAVLAVPTEISSRLVPRQLSSSLGGIV